MPVYLQLNLLSTEATGLRSPGGIITITQPRLIGEQLGFGGLAIVRSLTDRVGYFAYDLACPHEASRDVRLEVKEFELVCPRCQSHFDVLGGVGVPTSGVAQRPLRSYRVVMPNAGEIRILQ